GLQVGNQGGSFSKIYRNNGEGNFEEISTFLPGVSTDSSVDWGDYDNDGDLDILLVGGGGAYIYRNNGNNIFSQVYPSLPRRVARSSAAWGDYDNDGDLDLLLTGLGELNNPISKVYSNNGGAFTEIDTDFIPLGYTATAWGDYDKDGDLDILLTGKTAVNFGSIVSVIYQNNTVNSNTAPTAPSNLNFSVDGNSVNLNWDPATDAQTPQNGLTYNLRVGTTPGGSEIMSPMSHSDGTRKVVQMGNVNHNRRWTINNLEPGTYYWSVQAVDSAFAGSEFATEGTFTVQPISEPQIEWIRQVGTSSVDRAVDLAIDRNGNVYITGFTDGSLAESNLGERDAFVIKYDNNGNLVWSQQVGTSSSDRSSGITTDSNGNIYMIGTTEGSLGDTNAGSSDVWVSKHTGDGDLVWIRQLGASGSDESSDISIDSNGNIYITGNTHNSLGGLNGGNGNPDTFVAKYDNNGNRLWVRQLGTSAEDYSAAIATDESSNVYITGNTFGSLGSANAGSSYSSDAFISKYSSSGDLIWTKQLGSESYEGSTGIAIAPSGEIYITGTTLGTLEGTNLGSNDIFIAKYSINGDRLWTRQAGTSASDVPYSIVTDSIGNLYIVGQTQGELEGANAGRRDIFISKYDSNGNLLWNKQLGTSEDETGFDIKIDEGGNLYITGDTGGVLEANNAGSRDAWVAKLS
ncbi:SBBP repeat-containing protein, partial [Laspinema olomoucense]|uniref:SBBP repeat-containing protein n=1 Tax=Laspinema olomoucense TaxID=3231600 RepID=UPI0021BB09BB